ncbi:AMP-binding protein [Amycolatopsis acidiphila]|uniref:Cyclohexanecarboxylate-CoA ligase n=1 Tax=Amycolatopsis acidiphila TaxID=715473 RepID=A0A558AA79_9PSEU|nr:AMP-binding protein [Amycolatopsis acidiphila]TVT21162.1 cyclohexanecarboxylate-CoA ligase [Amycolatopsis acidiphila]UIJ57250.1 AMP-binding protein [Amycolatopsis acidiphila]GHG52404.1 cyclohexanecarboxylate-CoA ligase [Amycolatopsis acidiphila]
MAAEGFWDLVRRRAELSGTRPMLFDERDGSLTFAGFHERAERVAAALFAQGIGPGTRVGWQLPTRLSTVLVMAALARLGAVQAPVIPMYRERETGSAVAASAAEVMLVPGTWHGFDYAAMARGFPQRPRVLTIGVDAPESADTAGLPAAPGPSGDTRWIYFTSGSSGLPKGARHADGSLLAAARGFTVRSGLGSQPDDVGSMPYPIAHIGGIVYLMTALLGGFPVVLVEAFDPAGTAEVFRRHRVTTTGGSTVFYTALLAEQRKRPPGDLLVPSLRLLKGGGAPCPPSVFHAVRAELRATLAHDYGMTEVPMICVASPQDSAEQLAETEGRPIPGNQVRIADGEDVLPPGADGEVQVKGAAVFRGYTDPAQTAEAFTADGWFRTGDLGHLRPDGHVEVTGRLKDVIIRKGEKIGPVELETLLVGHPAVAEAAVIGLPDADRGERVCAVVTLRGDVRPTLAEITGYLREAGLMPQKLPEQLEIVDELPRTGLGKTSKPALRRRFAADGV